MEIRGRNWDNILDNILIFLISFIFATIGGFFLIKFGVWALRGLGVFS